MENIVDMLVKKSIEAFLLAIEIYNKPTIKYRTEGFSFFICNAWELLLKAHLIIKDGEKSIYYKDNPDRTISLENCIEKIFTNDKDPLRINLEKIIDLRNISTHFVTTDYEIIYAPLFQSCILNYSNSLLEFFNVDITDTIPDNFLTLSINFRPLERNEIESKYSKEIASRLLKLDSEINDLKQNNTSHKFAITIIHEHYITKKRDEADSIFAISQEADDKVAIVAKRLDPNNTHCYKMKGVINEINKRIRKDNLNFISLSLDPNKQHIFNRSHFDLFVKYYSIKDDENFCYKYRLGEQNSDEYYYSYSMAAIDFIYNEIKKDPENIIKRLKQLTKKE